MSDYMVEGVCRYCGQVQVVKASEPLEGNAADEWITRHCKCEDAAKARTAEAMEERIEALLNDCQSMGFKPENAETVEIVTQIAHSVLAEVIGNVALTLPSGDKLTIKAAKDDVSIKRQQKRTMEG